LRKYTDYENTSLDINLSSLDFCKLTFALRVQPQLLLGQVPDTFTAHWRKVSSLEVFAKHILIGRGELEVKGTPFNKKLRAPLIELVEIFEKSKNILDPSKVPLSVSLKDRFKCEDLLEKLTGVGAQGIETLLGNAQLFVMLIPKLRITNEYVYHDGDRTDHKITNYEWSHEFHYLIDFDGNSENDPVTHDYIFGDGADDFIWGLFAGSESQQDQEKEALLSRQIIPVFDEDEHIFQTEPYKNPEPKVDEGQLTVNKSLGSEQKKDIKEDGA